MRQIKARVNEMSNISQLIVLTIRYDTFDSYVGVVYTRQ